MAQYLHLHPYLSLADVSNGLHEGTEMNQWAPILPTEKLLKGLKVFPPRLSAFYF